MSKMMMFYGIRDAWQMSAYTFADYMWNGSGGGFGSMCGDHDGNGKSGAFDRMSAGGIFNKGTTVNEFGYLRRYKADN